MCELYQYFKQMLLGQHGTDTEISLCYDMFSHLHGSSSYAFGFHIYYLCYRLFRNPCFHDEERNRQQDFKIWEGVIAGRPEF